MKPYEDGRRSRILQIRAKRDRRRYLRRNGYMWIEMARKQSRQWKDEE